MSRAGSSSRKLPARTYSTSWHSAGEALSTDTARGRLLSAATAMIFVPLPRRVGPTAKPSFLRSRKWHRRTPHPDSAFPARAGAWPRASAPVPTCHCAPTAETGDGRSGTEGTYPAAHATAPLCPTPRAHHSVPNGYRAKDGHVYPAAALAAAPAQPRPIVYRSVPSVLSRRFAVIPEQPQDRTKSPFTYL
jgi:hypothetical protein